LQLWGERHALPRSLMLGVLFVCVLPSTVQSSIALTSIARGNVAAAVCAAAGSNIAGVLLTPILFALVCGPHGHALSIAGVFQIVSQLLVPFIAGHLLRPWIGEWADRNRPILAITDRSSILLIVYTGFSASVVQGLWQQLPLTTLARLALVEALLLATALSIMIVGSRILGFGRADESTVVFCGSQKSVVSGIPIASALMSGPALVICAWVARGYARRSVSAGEDAPLGIAAARLR
jgi:solute carrier family 10 (sodium/bile acid cotransporter), member 7